MLGEVASNTECHPTHHIHTSHPISPCRHLVHLCQGQASLYRHTELSFMAKIICIQANIYCIQLQFVKGKMCRMHREKKTKKRPKPHELQVLPPPPPRGETPFAIHSPWSTPNRKQKDQGPQLGGTPSQSLSKALDAMRMTVSGPASQFS